MTSCTSCGATLPADARFCSACGATATPGAAGTPLPPFTQQRTSTLAIVALVLASIPACLLHVVGIVLGVMALKEIDRTPGLKGRGLARAAIIVGSGWMVLSVLGILAAIAIPNYLKFQARAKQAEARTGLTAIATAAAAQGEVGSFADLEWKPAERHRYSYFLAQDALPAAQGGPYALPEEELPEGWRAAAVANVDGDETLDVWVLDEDGSVTHVVNDVQQ